MILIKVGGGKQINWGHVASDIKTLVNQGEQVVIIHGASQTRNALAKQLGTPTKVIVSPSGVSSVYTDQKAIDIFLMAYAGLVNKKIVARLQAYGINAIGLSGIDGHLWTGKRKKVVYSKEGKKTKIITDNLTGRIEKVNTGLIRVLLQHNFVPVICPPALDENNQIINADNDWATAVMAGSLKIDRIVVLFEAPGLLAKFGDESSLIKTVDKDQLDKYLNFAQGLMKKKILGAKEAFKLGVKKIFWSDGRIKNPVINALKGKGTVIS